MESIAIKVGSKLRVVMSEIKDGMGKKVAEINKILKNAIKIFYIGNPM